ncbi:MAG: hypothetical protein CBR30_09790 [Dictyoglomus sp. NZ13-RE01]|nr:MAG: hypothetical protein CBR30_09790 [Dictyoglomus sp. NZ13-RE01]
MSEQLTKQQEKLVEVLQEFFKLKEEDRERIIRIVKNNNPKKIVVALNNAYKIDRKGRKKPTMTLEEFERMLKKVRF